MTDAAQALFDLLDQRSPDATICPSEVARILAGPDGDWRAVMPLVHEAVDDLVANKAVRISWKGARLPHRKGPYRIARPDL